MSDPAHRPNPHNWGPALPGQGKVQVCRQCGAKANASSRDGECAGPRQGLVDNTLHDYEPIL